MKYWLAIVLAGWLAVPVAQASNAWQLVGEARLKVMFWDVYDSRLYSRNGHYDGRQRPVRLEIQYLRDIRASALLESTANEWKHLGVAPAHQRAWLAQLATIWPDIRRHDVLAFELNEAGQGTFFWNGREIGHISDPALGSRFLDIWLSPGTSQPELRLALLGQAAGRQEPRGR